MHNLDDRLLNKIRANIEKIGADLRDYTETESGDYLEKKDKAIMPRPDKEVILKT